MESSSIFDQIAITQSDDQEVLTLEGMSQDSGATDQTAALKEEDCPEDEEGAAAEGAAAVEAIPPRLRQLMLDFHKQMDEFHASMKAGTAKLSPMKP